MAPKIVFAGDLRTGDHDYVEDGQPGRAFAVVLISALATSVGSAAVFYPSLAKFAKAPVLGASLGFATGVMVYVSLVDIYQSSTAAFRSDGHNEDNSFIFTTLSFFGGILGTKVRVWMRFNALCLCVHSVFLSTHPCILSAIYYSWQM